MFTPYRALTSLLVTAGEVRGRKKLQKMVFIAQSLGHPFQEAFDLHVWGPYSEVLAVKVKEMTDWGFAREGVLPGPAGNSLYVYTPGPNAGRVVADSGDDDDRLLQLVEHLNGQDATFLEGVATVMFLQAKGKDDADVRGMLTRLKPDKFPDAGRVDAVMAFAAELEGFRVA